MLGLLVRMWFGHIKCSAGLIPQIGVVGQNRRRRSQETWEVVVRNGRVKLEMDSTGHQSKSGCKDQESIQSSTTPDPVYQWESNKLTVRDH